jgi:hypothetical protein
MTDISRKLSDANAATNAAGTRPLLAPLPDRLRVTATDRAEHQGSVDVREKFGLGPSRFESNNRNETQEGYTGSYNKP